MKVLERATTPNDIDIQIEDWSQDYSFHKFGDVVATYPKATYTANNRLEYPRFKETFRLEFNCEDDAQAREVFNNLKNGTKTLLDYSNFVLEKRYLEFV